MEDTPGSSCVNAAALFSAVGWNTPLTDHAVIYSTKRSESWAIETREAEKQRSQRKRRTNARPRNRGTKTLRRGLQPPVRRRRLGPYRKAERRCGRSGLCCRAGKSTLRLRNDPARRIDVRSEPGNEEAGNNEKQSEAGECEIVGARHIEAHAHEPRTQTGTE
jgi:hypothetical protein